MDNTHGIITETQVLGKKTGPMQGTSQQKGQLCKGTCNLMKVQAGSIKLKIITTMAVQVQDYMLEARSCNEVLMSPLS